MRAAFVILNDTRAIASVLFRNNARIRVANECVILNNAQVQVFILYSDPKNHKGYGNPDFHYTSEMAKVNQST